MNSDPKSFAITPLDLDLILSKVGEDLTIRAHLEQDEALTRRFVPIILSEPSPDQTRQILMSFKPGYELRYSVTVREMALTQLQ